MVKNLKRFRKQVEREQGRLEALKCDFFPTTYVLPVGLSLSLDRRGRACLFFSQNIISSWKNSNATRTPFGL